MVDQEPEDETGTCDWDRHAQAFRWFPELGPPVRPVAPAGSDEA